MRQGQFIHKSYQSLQNELGNDRGLEIRAFIEVTSKLKAANTEDYRQRSAFYEALALNSKLWRILYVDLVNPENSLPQELKVNLISLSKFTQSHTREVMRGEATHDVLIDMNMAIIRGLRDAQKNAQASSENTMESSTSSPTSLTEVA